MSNGVVIFAHNNGDIDYASLSLIAAKLAKTHLNVPVSVITDKETFSSVDQKEFQNVFDKIIFTPPSTTNNTRNLYDGVESKKVKFLNDLRPSVWDLTPYDRTLLIDCDYLIMSNTLSNYWDNENELLISGKYNDITGDERVGYHDRYVSDTGVKLYWATTVMFTKNERTKLFFDLVEHIRNNYNDYGDLFRFSTKQYRNDISFSIAKHILDGYISADVDLPPVLSTIDKDMLHSVDNGKLTFLLTPQSNQNYVFASVTDLDVHVMNKKSILRNAKELV